MKTIKKTSLIILAVLFITSCSEENIEPLFSVDTTEVSFRSEGEEKKVILSSNIAWSASSNKEWVTIDPLSGKEGTTLTLSATKNETEARTAMVTLTPEKGEAIIISVSQNEIGVQFETDVTEVSFNSEGEEKSIVLISNVEWSTSSSETWLTVDPTSGINGTTLTLTAAKNNLTEERAATVTLTPVKGNPIIISVFQDADQKPAVQFSIDATEVSFIASGEGKTVELISNVSWTASSNENWLTITPSSGTGGATLALIAAKNEDNRRTATVTIMPSEGSALTIVASQEAGTIKLFPGSDFKDWNTFLDNVFPDLLDFTIQSEGGVGVDGGRALQLSGIGLSGTSSANIFRAKTPADFSLEGKTKISFYIKGTVTPKSLTVLLYYEVGNYYYAYNLGNISTQDVIIEPNVGASGTTNGTTNYTGTINTQNQWIKVSLDISKEKLIYGYRNSPGQTLMALRLTGNTEFDLLVDNFIVE